MPRIIVETDPLFDQQLKDILHKYEIEERYNTILAIKSAIRQYWPLRKYWQEGEHGESGCWICLGELNMLLTVYTGRGTGGALSIMIKRIICDNVISDAMPQIPILI